jgi:hypothetical protein
MSRDALPVDAETQYLCVSGRGFLIIHGVFTTKAKAEAWRDAANIWHGEGHPLVPIRVEPVKTDIRPFPAAALQNLIEAETAGESTDEALRAMFATLDDDYDDQGAVGDRR